MKIIVPAIGSRGDVQPYIALCQGLRQAGHQAILATNPTLCSLAATYGIEVAPVGPPVDMGLEGAKIWARAGKSWWLGFIRIMQFGAALVEQAYPDILKLCQGADLVVVTDTGAGMVEADQLGLAWASVTLQPSRIPVPDASPSIIKRAVNAVMWPMVGVMITAPMNRFRKRVGAPLLKGVSGLGVFSSRLILVPVSRQVNTPHPRWPPHAHQTGYWFSQSPTAWTPPEKLSAFLEAGGRPVVIGFGAMGLTGKETHAAAHMALEAVKLAGVRAIVQGWDEVLAGVELPAAIYHAGSIPHNWLFERVSAVSHHGGFGTTASVLRAGVPGIVVPHIIDQFLWGQRVYDLGVGPKPIPRNELTAEKLAAALTQAVSDETMRARATQLGAEMRAEPDGVGVAVRLIEAAVR